MDNDSTQMWILLMVAVAVIAFGAWRCSEDPDVVNLSTEPCIMVSETTCLSQADLDRACLRLGMEVECNEGR